MRILLVGAGAVGQVYGYHLGRGGAEIDVLVKPARVAEARAGYRLYRLRRGERDELRFDPSGVHASLAALGRYDQVWLCMPTTALDDALLAPLAAAIGEALLVVLQPGTHVRALCARHVPPERTVVGLIGMVSYQAPLAGVAAEAALEPGVAFYLPGLAPSRFSGARAGEVVAALRRGGCPAKRGRDVGVSGALSTALLMPQIVALEVAGWSLRRQREPGHAALAAAACREATRLTAAQLGVGVPWYCPLLRGLLFRIIFRVAEAIAPFDLEAYLRYHFGKVRAQTALLVRSYLGESERASRPAPALRALGERAFGRTLEV